MRTNYSSVPAGLFHDPGWLLDQVSVMFSDAGTVIVPRVPRPVTTDEELSYADQLRECIRLAGERGWSASDIAAEQGYGWLTWTREGSATVHMGILPHIRVDGDQLVDPDDPAEVQADLLARYRAAVGIPWMSTAGVAGTNLLRAMYARPVRTTKGTRARQQPLWTEQIEPEWLGAGDIMWSRRLTGAEHDMAMVAQWDVRMAYGAAAGMAQLPVDALGEPTGPTQFDPDAAGYWRVRVPHGSWWAADNDLRPPVANPGRVQGDRTVVLTTPLLAYLHELKIRPEIVDSRTCPHTDRIMREWYERLRDARTMAPSADSPRLAAAIKSTANAAIGMMASGRGRVQRKVWAHTIQDLARANLLRKLDAAQPRIGWPFRIEHDSMWYTMPNPASLPYYEQALGVGHPSPGRLRRERVWSMTDYEQARRNALAARRTRRK